MISAARLATTAVVLSICSLCWASPSAAKTWSWVVSPAAAKSQIEAGATVLDVRSQVRFRLGHARGAQRVAWRDFTYRKKARRGILVGQPMLQRRLRALGLRKDRSVIVVGRADDGWGEEGRIVWMLRALGHGKAAMVDGGWSALVAAGVPSTVKIETPRPGDIVVARKLRYRASAQSLRKALGRGGVVVLDTRQKREYNGATPYGESRGGHVPGAKHLHWKSLLDAKGRLLKPKALRARLRALGVGPETRVIAYCTGGVRSGWLVAVLRDLGVAADNYAGSMWEWASLPAKRYPLESD